MLEDELDEESLGFGVEVDDVDESGVLLLGPELSEVVFASLDFESDVEESDGLLSDGVRDDAPP